MFVIRRGRGDTGHKGGRGSRGYVQGTPPVQQFATALSVPMIGPVEAGEKGRGRSSRRTINHYWLDLLVLIRQATTGGGFLSPSASKVGAREGS